MTNGKNTDWAATMDVLRNLPQDQHANYLATLQGSKQEVKEGIDQAKAKVESHRKAVQPAKSSAKPDTKPKRKARKREAARAVVLGVSLNYRQFSMLQTVRDLVASGVNGSEGLSSAEIAEYRECGETSSTVSPILDQLKDRRVIDWKLVDRTGAEVSHQHIFQKGVRREFRLMTHQG